MVGSLVLGALLTKVLHLSFALRETPRFIKQHDIRTRLYILDRMSYRHIARVFAGVRIALTASMKAWRIGVLSLLLASAAIAQEDVLDADRDDPVGTLDDKMGAVDTTTALEDLSWQAAEVLIDTIKEFGNISRNI